MSGVLFRQLVAAKVGDVIDRQPTTEEVVTTDPHAAVVEVLAELEAAPSRPVQWFDILRGAVLILLPPALLVGGIWWSFESLRGSGSRHYSRLPAATVFRKVTGIAVPKGVTELRAAGTMGPLGLKHQVWMSFRFQPGALHDLLEGANSIEREKVETSLTGPPYERDEEEYRDHVGWSGISGIAGPEIYMLSASGSGSFIWMDTLVLDRKNGRAYLHATGD